MIRKQGHAELPISLDEAYRKSAEALNVIGAKVTNEDQARTRIEGAIGANLMSWGENILVEITGVDNAASISVTSSSRLPTTLIDFGKNKRNVKRFLDSLSR